MASKLFEPRVWDEAETAEILSSAKKGLERAKSKRRNAIYTAVIRGWSYRKIAKEVGLSPGRISQILHEDNE